MHKEWEAQCISKGTPGDTRGNSVTLPGDELSTALLGTPKQGGASPQVCKEKVNPGEKRQGLLLEE